MTAQVWIALVVIAVALVWVVYLWGKAIDRDQDGRP